MGELVWSGLVDHDGMFAGYRRLSSVQKVEPPFTWFGWVRVHEVMNPPVFGEGWRTGQTASYQPKLNFHPLYPSNDRNVVCGPGNVQADPTVVGVSAEMRDVRPDRPYGVRTGYKKLERVPLPSTPVDGRWHHFRWEVPSRGEYLLYWDGRLVCHVVERVPVTIDPGPVSVGLRLDFLDVDLGPMFLEDGVVAIQSRESWQDRAQPVTGPPPKGKLGTWVIHYPGGGTPPPDTAQYLRDIQAGYLANRHYSIGYNWGVSQDGVGWEIRGNDFNNAANAGRKVEGNFNDVSQSIFVMVSGQDEATPDAVRKINQIIATRPDWDVIVHSDVDYTACAGAGLTAQVRAGIIGNQRPSDDGEGSVFQKMIQQRNDPAVWALYSGGYKVWVSTEGARDFLIFASGKPVEVIDRNESVMRATGPIMGPVPAGYDEWGNRL